MTAPAGQSGIGLKTHHPAIILYWYFMRSHVQIDGGQQTKHKWGDDLFYALPPGQHTVHCYAKSMLGFGLRVAKTTTTVNVAPGQVVRLEWKTPFIYFPFVKGKFTVVG